MLIMSNVSLSKVSERKKIRASDIKKILDQLPAGIAFKKITNVVDYITKQLKLLDDKYKTIHRTTISNCKYCMNAIEKWWLTNPEVLKRNDINTTSTSSLQTLLLKERLTVATLLKKIKILESKTTTINNSNNENISDDSHVALYLLLKYLDSNDFGVTYNKKVKAIIDSAHHNNIIIVNDSRLDSYSSWLKSNSKILPLIDKLSDIRY